MNQCASAFISFLVGMLVGGAAVLLATIVAISRARHEDALTDFEKNKRSIH